MLFVYRSSFAVPDNQEGYPDIWRSLWRFLMCDVECSFCRSNIRLLKYITLFDHCIIISIIINWPLKHKKKFKNYFVYIWNFISTFETKSPLICNKSPNSTLLPLRHDSATRYVTSSAHWRHQKFIFDIRINSSIFTATKENHLIRQSLFWDQNITYMGIKWTFLIKQSQPNTAIQSRPLPSTFHFKL